MSAPTLLQSLAARGVALGIDGDGLRIDAPAGVLSDRDKAAIRENKNDIILLLRLPGATFDGKLWTWRNWIAPTKATRTAYVWRLINPTPLI